MKNVVDSSGWIEYLTQGPGIENFRQPLADTAQLVVAAVSITEVFRFVLRESGKREALRVAALMRRAEVVPLMPKLSIAAAGLGHKYQLPLADSIIYATAQQERATLWTQDADFEGLPDVKYFFKIAV